MSGVGLAITVNDRPVNTAIANMLDMGMDLRPLLEDLGMEGEESTRLRFDTNIAPDGTPWKPSLRAQVTGGKTLKRDGFLQDSIVYQLDGGDAVEWGSNLIYAAIHQTGGEIFAKSAEGLSFFLATGAHVVVQKVTIPAREFLGISYIDEQAFLSITVDRFDRSVGGY